MERTVVIIDDEFTLRDTLSMFVEELGYDSMVFGSLKEAESLYATIGCSGEGNKTRFMIDQNLPDGKGLDFISQRIETGKCRCGGRCMAIMSGALTNTEFEFAEILGCSILDKPVMFDDLKMWLESASA